MSYNIFLKMQIQGIKDCSYFKKPKFKDLKSVFLYDNIVKLFKKDEKDKKNSFKAKSKNILKIRKSKLWPLALILLKT